MDASAGFLKAGLVVTMALGLLSYCLFEIMRSIRSAWAAALRALRSVVTAASLVVLGAVCGRAAATQELFRTTPEVLSVVVSIAATIVVMSIAVGIGMTLLQPSPGSLVVVAMSVLTFWLVSAVLGLESLYPSTGGAGVVAARWARWLSWAVASVLMVAPASVRYFHRAYLASVATDRHEQHEVT